MTSDADRAVRKRQRRAAGVRCYRLELPEVELEEMLIAEGALRESDRDDPIKVSAALNSIIGGLIHNRVTRDAAEFFAGLRSGSTYEPGDQL